MISEYDFKTSPTYSTHNNKSDMFGRKSEWNISPTLNQIKAFKSKDCVEYFQFLWKTNIFIFAVVLNLLIEKKEVMVW